MAFSASFVLNKRLISLFYLSICVMMFATLAGCERSAPSASQSFSEQKKSATIGEAGRESGSKKAADPVRKVADSEEKAVACSYDAQCTGYLRCIEDVCAVPQAITGVHDETTPVVVFRADKSRDSAEISRFYVELAVSNLEQQRGLMYRRTMQPDWGMLFIYAYDEHHAFWMKNTLLPLDMVFVNAAGQVVGVVEAAEPLTLDRREVDDASRYILELNAGVAARSGVRTGVWIGFENIAKEHAPQF